MAAVDRYHVARRFPVIVHIAIITILVVAVLALGGLAEWTFGFGNLIVIAVLLPVVLRLYLHKRTALLIDEQGVTVGGQTVHWGDLDALVVLGPTETGDAVELQVTPRRSGWGFVPEAGADDADGRAIRGRVPRDELDPRKLRAAVRTYAPGAVRVAGWGIDDLEPEDDEPAADGGDPSAPPATQVPDRARPTERSVLRAWLADPLVLMGVAVAVLAAVLLVVRAATTDDDSARDRGPSSEDDDDGRSVAPEAVTEEPAAGPTSNQELLTHGEPGLLFDEVVEDGIARRMVVGGFTVTDVVVDPACPDGFIRPTRGHYLRIDLYMQILDDLPGGLQTPTREPYAYWIPPGPLNQGIPLLFSIDDEDGNEVQAYPANCERPNRVLPEELSPGESWRGSVFLDVPVTSGTLTFPVHDGGDDRPSSVSWNF